MASKQCILTMEPEEILRENFDASVKYVNMKIFSLSTNCTIGVYIHRCSTSVPVPMIMSTYSYALSNT